MKQTIKTTKVSGRHSHNPKTRGLYKYGKEPLGWNPDLLEKQHLPEPLDELKLDWVHEITYYAAENRYKAAKYSNGDGTWDYVLEDRRGNHMLTITSSQDLLVASKRKKKDPYE